MDSVSASASDANTGPLRIGSLRLGRPQPATRQHAGKRGIAHKQMVVKRSRRMQQHQGDQAVQNNVSWVCTASACNASLWPVNAGRLNKPNHCKGKPAAELSSQPLSGIASNSTYNAMWVS